jgi:hypothetical protein
MAVSDWWRAIAARAGQRRGNEIARQEKTEAGHNRRDENGQPGFVGEQAPANNKEGARSPKMDPEYMLGFGHPQLEPGREHKPDDETEEEGGGNHARRT